MEEERDKAEAVKQHQPILVILGNPPYNGFAGSALMRKRAFLDPYKEGLREWGITKNYLDDLYVRFLRWLSGESRVTTLGSGVLDHQLLVSSQSFVCHGA